MSEHGLLSGYERPDVVDYGTLVELTATAHLVLGTAHVSDMSFSAPVSPGVGAPGVVGSGPDPSAGGVSPGAGSVGAVTTGGVPGGAGAAGGGGTHGAGGASAGQLPFTGLAAGAVAAIGSALAMGGGALRRAARGRRRR